MGQFRVHKLENILSNLRDLKTDVLFIPPGLKGKLQPLDVYCNKPMKDELRKYWETYSTPTQNLPLKNSHIVSNII